MFGNASSYNNTKSRSAENARFYFPYPGEANAGAPDMYKCRFPAMINDWRTKFNLGTGGQTDASFPFGFVQVNSLSFCSNGELIK